MKVRRVLPYILIYAASLAAGMIFAEFDSGEEVYIAQRADTEETLPPERGAENTSPSEETAAEERIDINTASAEEIAGLDGIGEDIAERIIRYRERIGAFEVTEDIMKVVGVGESKYEKIKERITVQSRRGEKK